MKINDFWEDEYKEVRNLDRGSSARKNGVFISSGKVIKKNSFMSLVVNEKLRPEWISKGERINVFVPRLFKNLSKGEVLADFLHKEKRFPAIVKEKGRIIFNFSPVETIKTIIGEKYYKPKRRLYTYFPIHMHVLPGELRRIMKKALFMFQREKSRFPSWPVDKSVELLRHVIFRSITITGGRITGKIKWPKGKRYVVCITHDIETGLGFKIMPRLLKIEKKYGLKSSFGIVSNHYRLDHPLLDKMAKDGNNFYLHDYNHDNKLIYLGQKGMQKRFDKMGVFRNRYNAVGFRSPCLLRSEALFAAVEKNGYLYDSSVPDTENPSQISERNGCCTVFPYMIGNLVEIPITMPQDALLIFKKKNLFNVWTKKLEFIKQIGGIAVMNIHPEPHLSGNKENLIIYEKFLEYISKDKSAWITTIEKLADYSIRELNRHPKHHVSKLRMQGIK
jgi:peptidoglycan/xylan/chitin deacetylase (PgdA/CDA1 family)